MANPLPNLSPTKAGPRIAWWGFLLACLTAEIVCLGLRFDTAAIADLQSGWAVILQRSPAIVQLGLAIGAATLILALVRMKDAVRRAFNSGSPTWSSGLFLGMHFAALCGFTYLTAYLFDESVTSVPNPGAWVFAWLLSLAATLLFWCLAALPWVMWREIFSRGVLALGIAVGLAAWLAGQLTELLWLLLGRSTLWITYQLLSLVSRDVLYRPEFMIIGIGTEDDFGVQVTQACSGLYGVGMIWVFLGVYLFLFRRRLRFPHALLLLPIGTGIIWLANSARIAALVAIGRWWSPEIALGGFHSQAGWLAFLGIALGLVAIAEKTGFAARVSLQAPAEAHPTAHYLLPLVAALATALITEAFSDGTFDRLYPIRVVAALAVLGFYWKRYARWPWRPSISAIGLGVVTASIWWVAVPAQWDEPYTLSKALEILPSGYAYVWVAARLLGFVVVTPMIEELAFRGYLTRRLVSADVDAVPSGRLTWLSFLGSSLLFGLMHGNHWVAGTIAGMIFALALMLRGKIADAVYAHAIANALLVVYGLYATPSGP